MSRISKRSLAQHFISLLKQRAAKAATEAAQAAAAADGEGAASPYSPWSDASARPVLTLELLAECSTYEQLKSADGEYMQAKQAFKRVAANWMQKPTVNSFVVERE
jgi:hypothetical protein